MLTDVSVRNAKPKDKPYKITDEKGMYLFVQPAGGKLWRFDYRYFGKRKTKALGSYPDISLNKARELRDEARKLLAVDVDPSEVRKAEKSSKLSKLSNTFEIIAREWVSTHLMTKSKNNAQRSLRRFELYLFPKFGSKAILDITPPEILSAIRIIQNLNKTDTAKRTLQTAGQVWRYAVQTGRAERDITADLKGAIPNSKVNHMAAFTDPKDISGLLRAIDGFTGTLTVQTALKFAPLVFVRPGELRKAKWADIDFKAAEWRYTVTKTNTEHIVPLSRQALEILKEIHPYSGAGEVGFVNGHNSKEAMSDAAVNAALRRMGYDTKTEITGHGFRAIARTLLHERLGIDPNIIEHQLAHRVPDVLGGAYNRTKFLEQRKEMMQKWADYLDELKELKS
jgi:integrase